MNVSSWTQTSSTSEWMAAAPATSTTVSKVCTLNVNLPYTLLSGGRELDGNKEGRIEVEGWTETRREG